MTEVNEYVDAYSAPAIINETPSLKAVVFAWLMNNHTGNGNIKGDLYDVAKESRAAIPDVARALWDIQKMGYITFRERKGEGTDGHGSTTVLTDFNLTAKGMEYLPKEPAAPEPEPVVEEWEPEDTPAGRLVSLLRGQPAMLLKEANVALGYHPLSTALYSLVRSNPKGFRIAKAHVQYIGPPGWKPKPSVNIAPGRPRGVTMYKGKPLVVAGPTPVTEVVSPVTKPTLGPEVLALLKREQQRAKVSIAIKALEDAGLDDSALPLLTVVPDDSPLEREVLDLVRSLGYQQEKV